MGIIKIKKDIETKKKVKHKNIKIKEIIENNLIKEYSNEYFINYYNNNYYEIFDKIQEDNYTLKLINKITQNKDILNLYNICFYKINYLPYCQIIYYLLYKLYNEKINLKPEVYQNFIYNYNNNIIEINFEKYTLQSFIIINDFLKPKILELFNFNIDTMNKIYNTDENKEKKIRPFIFIFHNIHKLNEHILNLLLCLIKTSYEKTNTIRFIISSNYYLSIKTKSLIYSNDIICKPFTHIIYEKIYSYIYNANYEIIFNKNITYNNIITIENDNKNDNKNDKNINYLDYKKYLEIYPYYKISKIHNILIYLLNIDLIYNIKINSEYKEQEFNNNTIEYIRNKTYNIPLFENNLYNLLNKIIFIEKPLITIIDNIKELINNYINYDIDYYLYIKIIMNYFQILINNIDKKVHNKIYKKLLQIIKEIYIICGKYELIQKKSKFINDFIIYEQILLNIYKIFYKNNFYKFKNENFNSKFINELLINNKIYSIQLHDY